MPQNIEYNQETRDTALLIATFRSSSDKNVCEEHLDELAHLADTYGIDVAEKIATPIRKIEAATFLGSGKIVELVERAKELSVQLILIDEEITPAQQRNLEKAFGLTVMDRTELILGVFAARAQTKEARLQIELAQVKYQLPRLKRLWTHLHRQTGSGGSGVFVKGEGEKQIEIDKRLLQKRIDQLQKEIDEVEMHRKTQRSGRKKSGIPSFAIIGYTNAGKSTLLNALTDADVFVEDKLFATLDTTTRRFSLPNNQQILLIDTVGFIRKLPHLLVAAFKGTLEESMQADILLHLIDISHDFAEDHAESSYEVLKEMNVGSKPVITVLNKVDQLADSSKIIYFRTKYPKTVVISAKDGKGFTELMNIMIDELRKTRQLVHLRIPQSDYATVSTVMEQGKIMKQDYEGNDVLLKAEIPIPLLGQLSDYLE